MDIVRRTIVHRNKVRVTMRHAKGGGAIANVTSENTGGRGKVINTRRGGEAPNYARPILNPGSCQHFHTTVPNWNRPRSSRGLDPGECAWYSCPTLGITYLGELEMAASTGEMLRSLYSDKQLAELDRVRELLLRDPQALDTHSREKRDGKQG